jgi:hypothetical protein
MMSSMKTTNPIHIFKPGVHITAAGDKIEFSEADITAIAQSYNPALYEAPLVIGHPRTDDPAQGWVQSLSANKFGLFAVARDVDVAFSEQVKDRRYGKVSSKFYRPTDPANPTPGKWALQHVGFLGAMSPGVKGLENPAFCEGDGGVAFAEAVEFAGWEDRNIAGMFRSLRDWLIAEFGLEKADRALPSWNVDTAQEDAVKPEPDASVSPAFSEPNQPPKEELPVSKTQAELEAEVAQLKLEAAQRDLRDKKASADKRHAGNVEFAEGLIGKGVLAPKDKDSVIAVMDLASTPGTVEFGEGDDKQPLIDAFKTFLGSMPKVVEFGEHATKGRAVSGKEINPLLADAESRASGK